MRRKSRAKRDRTGEPDDNETPPLPRHARRHRDRIWADRRADRARVDHRLPDARAEPRGDLHDDRRRAALTTGGAACGGRGALRAFPLIGLSAALAAKRGIPPALFAQDGKPRDDRGVGLFGRRPLHLARVPIAA